MQFNLKSYQIYKTKQYLQESEFLLFSIGANQNSQNWVAIEQNLQKLSLNYYKTYNNITIETLKHSVYENSFYTINSTFFFLTPQKNSRLLTRNNLINTLSIISFIILAFKLAKKMYLITQLNNMVSFNYKKNLSITYQFLITIFKCFHRLKKDIC